MKNVSRYAKDTPFHEYCQKVLNNPHSISLLGNEELAQKKSEYAFKILEIKQKLKSNWNQCMNVGYSNIYDVAHYDLRLYYYD